MAKAPITNVIFGTMTLGYRVHGARVHDAATARALVLLIAMFIGGGAMARDFTKEDSNKALVQASFDRWKSGTGGVYADGDMVIILFDAAATDSWNQRRRHASNKRIDHVTSYCDRS